ncbi:patatin-like phospholipase family protein [Polaribacter litorisediminis]|uniref:patatin-like phospholipase family protein n=1 Tax=Polaribacter litorisediminis TaxID=1908341 RepID=UPI001CBC5C51|nr:patatin-like phospholipase family protein [Polaribacter litorisediminis]UAM97385.1 patatin-like phospholipase family protein [Polaribacter litorisediminis]
MNHKLFFLFFIIPIIFFAQQKQPKVGLVLSGGGAKGFAHIATLIAIDKAGIQLDYIGGTSMGAIIGGLYAAGYSAIEIEEIVKKTDFISLLRDELPRKASTFFEKEYGEKTKITLPVTAGSVGLPKAVSKGQNILNFLFELLDTTEDITDFSKLPIPFFCIATDVENGGAVLLEEGSLPLALRASGSFPTLLNPVTIKDKLLIDGGLANNFPVGIMEAKGMDIIIGADVQGRLYEKEKLTSLIAILNQIVGYQMYDKSKNEKVKLDVYIHPDIFKYKVVDFDKKNEIIKKGEEEVEKFTKIFKEIAAKQTIKKKRKPIKVNRARRRISSINIMGIEDYTRAYVLGKLKIREGDSLSREEISERIQLLSGTKNYDRILYSLKRKEDASYLLNFILKETKDNATISLGAHYDFLYKSGVLANYRQKHLLNKNDLFSLDVMLGDNLRYNLNYFVDNGFYISYGFRSRYDHFRDNAKYNLITGILPNVSKINVNYTDFTNQLFVQTTFNRKFALGLGIEHKYLKAKTATITTNNNETILDNSTYHSSFGYLTLDTYDKKYFVTKGYFADLNFKWYMASSNYNQDFKSFGQAKGTLGFATSFGDRLTFQNTHEAGFTLNNPTSNVFDFYLGGYNQNYINTFVSFYGYDFADLSNNSFVKSEFNLRYRFYEKNYITVIANYARLEDNVFENIDVFKNIYSGYALGYSYDSIIGPIELKYSWSPDTKQNYWLFNLGFWF